MKKLRSHNEIQVNNLLSNNESQSEFQIYSTMAEQIAKKRGRPKKVAEPIEMAATPTTPKKPRKKASSKIAEEPEHTIVAPVTAKKVRTKKSAVLETPQKEVASQECGS